MRWLLIDRFVAIQKGKFAKGVRCVTRSEGAIAEKYPDFPVMPPSLLLEMMAQVGGVLVGATIDFKKEVVLAKISGGDFFNRVTPPATLEIEGRLADLGDDAAATECEIFSEGKSIAKATIFFGLFTSLDESINQSVVFSRDFMESFGIRQLIEGTEAKESPMPAKRQSPRRVVITGIGMLNACGSGHDAFWESALQSRAGLSVLPEDQYGPLPIPVAGAIPDFKMGQYIKNRKSIKVMCRDIRMAVVASFMAREDAGLKDTALDSQRSGVCIGAGLFNHEPEELAMSFKLSADNGTFNSKKFGQNGMSQLFPLWLLKYLPNMPACHVSISHGLRGPSNTITTDSAASASAFEEAYRVIERGTADVMFCGGAESKLNPAGILRYRSIGLLRNAENSDLRYSVFSQDDAGLVPGEGSCMMILEEREHALKRGARIYAEVGAAYACANTDHRNGSTPNGSSREDAIRGVIEEAQLSEDRIDGVHLNANGILHEDTVEASILENVFKKSKSKPTLVVSKSLTGYLGYASASTEIALAALSLHKEKWVPSLIHGESFLKHHFEFSQVRDERAKINNLLVHHFVGGLTNHVFLLKSSEARVGASS